MYENNPKNGRKKGKSLLFFSPIVGLLAESKDNFGGI